MRIRRAHANNETRTDGHRASAPGAVVRGLSVVLGVAVSAMAFAGPASAGVGTQHGTVCGSGYTLVRSEIIENIGEDDALGQVVEAYNYETGMDCVYVVVNQADKTSGLLLGSYIDYNGAQPSIIDVKQNFDVSNALFVSKATIVPGAVGNVAAVINLSTSKTLDTTHAETVTEMVPGMIEQQRLALRPASAKEIAAANKAYEVSGKQFKSQQKMANAKAKKAFKKKYGKKYAKKKSYKKAIAKNKRTFNAQMVAARHLRTRSSRTQEFVDIVRTPAMVRVDVVKQVPDVKSSTGVGRLSRT